MRAYEIRVSGAKPLSSFFTLPLFSKYTSTVSVVACLTMPLPKILCITRSPGTKLVSADVGAVGAEKLDIELEWRVLDERVALPKI